jgi:TPR repeat protein
MDEGADAADVEAGDAEAAEAAGIVLAAARRGLSRGDSAALAALTGPLLRLAIADAEAAWLAGQLFARGLGVPRDVVRAEFWYLGAEAMGHAEATFELALLDTAPQHRLERLQSAAAAGSHRAMLKLGDEARAANLEAAIAWYERAAAAGNGRAAASLGRLVEAGALPGGEGAAKVWFARAEALDYPWWELAE